MFQSHPRSFEANLYVYPVLSRRAGGVSIGVNLNPEKFCNFDCVYCQVDRSQQGGRVVGHADVPRLAKELDEMLDWVTSGRIFEETRFSNTAEPLRRLNDIALSGDGEPTSCPVFGEVVQLCAKARRRRRLDDVKLILITNATLLHRQSVRSALEVLDANNGEIWGKLDSGTEEYYQRVARTQVPFQQILDNLHAAARIRPIVIQTLFMRLADQPPTMAQQDSYCDRLCEITSDGGQIKLVQIHTVARRPAESWVAPLSTEEVDAVVQRVRRRTGLQVAGFYGYPS